MELWEKNDTAGIEKYTKEWFDKTVEWIRKKIDDDRQQGSAKKKFTNNIMSIALDNLHEKQDNWNKKIFRVANEKKKKSVTATV